MEKYKFKIGQEVKYSILDVKLVECKCCGNVEEKFFQKKVKGKIISKDYEVVYSTPSFMTTDKVEIKDGKTIHKPYMSDITMPTSEPFYKIKRTDGSIDNVSEKAISN